MKTPVQVTFHNMEHSPAVETAIRERAGQLEKFCADIIGCQVEVEAPHRHHHRGNLFEVRLRVTVPGTEIVANRNPDEDHAHEDVYVALRDAFRAARRQLEDYVRRRRGDVKSHSTPAAPG